MRIMSIDQATNSGIAIFNNGELLHYELHKSPRDKKDKKYTQEEKIELLLDRIRQLIKEYSIDIVAFEDVQSQKSPTTYKTLSILLGCIRQELFRMGIRYEIIPCATWRSILGIKGRGRDILKKKAQEYVFAKYGIEVNSDIADSICLGLAFIWKLKIKQEI